MNVMHKLLVGLLAMGLSVAAPAGFALADDDDDAADDSSAAPSEDSADDIADNDPSAVVIFREKLSPYGTWTVHPDYGTVWVPSSRVVGTEFSPYVTSGHWELTPESEWLWVSDYDWGYVPFHYGRWIWVSDIGWAWIPGRVYSPAWVVWRTGADGYIGWGPAPAEYYWVDGYSYSFWSLPVVAYVFCPTNHVFHHDVHTYVIHDRTGVSTAAKSTRPYHPAKPSTSTRKHGTPRSHGPSAEEAHIDKADLPKVRAAHNVKAMEFMKPESIAKSKNMAKAVKGSTTTTMSAPKRSRGAGVAGFTAPARETVNARAEAVSPKTERPSRAEQVERESAPVERAERSERANRAERFDRPERATESPRKAVPKASRTEGSRPRQVDRTREQPARSSARTPWGDVNAPPRSSRGSESSSSSRSSTPRMTSPSRGSSAPPVSQPSSSSAPSKAVKSSPKSSGGKSRSHR